MNWIKKNVLLAVVALVAIPVFNTHAQNFKKIKPYSWMIGIHWNVIDDDGRPYTDLFNFSETWNIRPYPSTLNIDYYFMKGLSAELMANYNLYRPSKIINGEDGRSGFVINTDLNAKYSFGFLMRQQRVDPFTFLGFSYTLRTANDQKNMFAPNVGFGVNFMIWEGLGIQVRSAAKIAVYPRFFKHESNYLHHHIGLIYKIPDMSQSRQDRDKKRYDWLFKKPRFKQKNGL